MNGSHLSVLGRVRGFFSGLISADMQADEEQTERRRQRLEESPPPFLRIPLAGNLLRWCALEGIGNTCALTVILILFTAIKAPYFDLPLTGLHSMKYSTYVEPALYMSERNNPIWYQQKYSARIDTEPDGIHDKFTDLPLFEWGLYLTYELVPFGTLEVKTRLFTHMLGLWILLGAYCFFTRWLPRRLSLTILFFMAINPLLLFATYVTVLDSLVTALMFGSLVVLSDYLRSQDIRRLFWSGILFGIGNLVKYSLFLWLAPLGVVFLFLTRKDMPSFLRDAGLYLFLGLVPILTWNTSLNVLPSAPWRAIGLFVPWVILYVLLYQLLVRKESAISDLTAWFWRRKVVFAVLVVMVGIPAIYVPGVLMPEGKIREFLTGPGLLFNFRMYRYMLLVLFADYMTPWLFRFGILGLVLIPFFRFQNLNRVAASFLAGSLVYWVVASKAIFIHNYYTVIIMILFSLLGAIPVYAAVASVTWKAGKLAVLAAFAGLAFPAIYRQTNYMLGDYDDVSDVVEYIRQNTSPDDLILHHGVLTPLIIYTGRHFVYPYCFDFPTIEREIKELGFAGAMKKRKVKYLFTPYYIPVYEDYVPWFEGKKMPYNSWDRYTKIMKEIGAEAPDVKEAQDEVWQAVKRYGIESKFKQEAEFGEWGRFKIYSFQD